MSPQITLRKEPILDSKTEAFSYQMEALAAVRDLPYAAIFHEQGLGKSKIAIDLALYWLESKAIDTVLFVVKKSLISNWIEELETHSHIKAQLLTQNKRDNYFVFNGPNRLVLTHYEVLRSETERFQLYLKARDVAVILDESTKIKNPDSSISVAFHSLSALFKKRVIMTGTPIANRPYDIWSQIFFLDQGKSLGRDFNAFRLKHNLSNQLGGSPCLQASFEHSLATIWDLISSFCVRRTKNDGILTLPKKKYHKILCDWEERQSSLYNEVRKQLQATVIHDGVPIVDESEQLLKRLLRLVQIASNPCLIDDSYDYMPGKWEHLMDVLNEVVKNGEKCIIWTTFTANADWLCSQLRHLKAVKVHGKLDMRARDIAISRFKTDTECRVLVATPGAAKEGFTLTVANHVVFFDRSFSLDDYLQAQDRIHRISQDRECHIYNLVMADSIRRVDRSSFAREATRCPVSTR